MVNQKLYYSFLHDKDPNIVEDTYYNASEFEWSAKIEQSWQDIHKEVLALVKNNESELKPYFAKEMVNAPKKWKALSFYFWGLKMSKNAIYSCPKTISVLNQIPDLISASVSIMEPHAEIKPHYGDTDAIFRCHLGLEIPGELPECGFRVGYEDRSWQEGKLLIFNDAAYHKAWNYTNKRRVILLFDIIKPQYKRKKKWICAKVRGNILYQFILNSIGIKPKKNIFSKIFSYLFALIYFSIQFPLDRKSVLLK